MTHHAKVVRNLNELARELGADLLLVPASGCTSDGWRCRFGTVITVFEQGTPVESSVEPVGTGYQFTDALEDLACRLRGKTVHRYVQTGDCDIVVDVASDFKV